MLIVNTNKVTHVSTSQSSTGIQADIYFEGGNNIGWWPVNGIDELVFIGEHSRDWMEQIHRAVGKEID